MWVAFRTAVYNLIYLNSSVWTSNPKINLPRWKSTHLDYFSANIYVLILINCIENFNKFLFITAHKRSLQRLCFYTCLSFCSQGGVCLWSWGLPLVWGECWHPQAETPWVHTPLSIMGYGQQVGGTHPTGMHSCFIKYQSTHWQNFNLSDTGRKMSIFL